MIKFFVIKEFVCLFEFCNPSLKCTLQLSFIHKDILPYLLDFQNFACEWRQQLKGNKDIGFFLHNLNQLKIHLPIACVITVFYSKAILLSPLTLKLQLIHNFHLATSQNKSKENKCIPQKYNNKQKKLGVMINVTWLQVKNLCRIC